MATQLAHRDEWSGRDVRVDDIERALCELREEAAAHDDQERGADLWTSVMTHIAWVPSEWEVPALETLAGLAERHPSRAILLFPEPDAPDGLDARATVIAHALPDQHQHVAAEVIELTLRGTRARVPASIVVALLIPDLPVFVRWRGQPPFGAAELEQLVDLADRLVVDSREWPDVPRAYADLATLFERIASSDIAWRRTLPWQRRLARHWPAIAEIRELGVTSPPAEALLLAGWLRSRLGKRVELAHDDADELTAVTVDGEPVSRPRVEPPTPSDLLSAELDELGRDHVYEGAVRAN
jgi:Glucose-6-phosphate dehydrogenase subunit